MTAEQNGSLSARAVADLLGLEPLPFEGGWFRRTFADANCSTILYLMAHGDGFSAMHQLDGPEILTFAAGSPARNLLLFADGSSSVRRLGSDLAAGDVPQIVVEAGVWQGTETLGSWTLISATMAPPYEQELFHLGSHVELAAGWPDVAELIERLTRPEEHHG
ncbi:MAG: cupin domain-containing protein [Ilumatobacteraceae bacterium]